MFSSPAKRIFESSDLPNFQNSAAYKRLHQAIAFIVDKAKSTEVPPGWLLAQFVTRPETTGKDRELLAAKQNTAEFSKTFKHAIAVLDKFNELVDETPPLEGPRRFGNMACRDWHAKVEAKAGEYLAGLVLDGQVLTELQYYLVNSFGSSVRLDYGSGHELSFIAFVGGLIQTGDINAESTSTELLALFAKYYDLVRRLIVDYNLEPAGSHGVWGLDDHFHFIYILGAAQFNVTTTNKSQYVPPVLLLLSTQTISSYELSNFYANGIAFIFKIKLGPFHEHSPIIYDINKSVSLWAKVLSGLLKMYEVEVFGKFPVMQHFWFGSSLYPWTDAATSKALPVRPVEETRQEEKKSLTNGSDDHIPGLINGFKGQRTTKNNITMTGAPWARPTGRPGVLTGTTMAPGRGPSTMNPRNAERRP